MFESRGEHRSSSVVSVVCCGGNGLCYDLSCHVVESYWVCMCVFSYKFQKRGGLGSICVVATRKKIQGEEGSSTEKPSPFNIKSDPKAKFIFNIKIHAQKNPTFPIDRQVTGAESQVVQVSRSTVFKGWQNEHLK